LLDFLAFLFEFIGSFSPIRVIVALIPTLIVSGFAYWLLPDKTIGAWAFGVILVSGISLGIWWHIRESKYDRPA
jgi:hypothetical protein